MRLQDCYGKLWIRIEGSPEDERQTGLENIDRTRIPCNSMWRYIINFGLDLELGFVRATYKSDFWVVDGRYLGPHYGEIEIKEKEFRAEETNSVRNYLESEAINARGHLAQMAEAGFIEEIVSN